MKIIAKIILSVALVAPMVVHADAPLPARSESELVEHGSYINKDGYGFTRLRTARTANNRWERRHDAVTEVTVSAGIIKARVPTMVVFRAGSVECVHYAPSL